VGRRETQKGRVEHAVAVPGRRLQSPQGPETRGVPTGLVLALVDGADGLAAHPRAESVPAVVAKITLDALVLGVQPRRDPQRAVEGNRRRIRGMVVPPGGLEFVAGTAGVAGARETVIARLDEGEKVVPFFRFHGDGVLDPAPFRHLFSARPKEIRG